VAAGKGGDGPKQPSSVAADADTEQKVVAATDCSKRSKPKKRGFDPLIPQEIPCAVKEHTKLYVGLTCPMTNEDKGKTLYPGMAGEAVGLGTGVTADDPPLRTDIKIKLTTGEEGIVLGDCLSKSPMGVSFLPPKKKPANGEAALFGVMKSIFDEAYPLSNEMLEMAKKKNYGAFDRGSPDAARWGALGSAAQFYETILHNFTYGSGRTLDQVLSKSDLQWLADWPDDFGVTYADGLKGKAKDKAVVALECLKRMSNFYVFLGDYEKLRSDDANLDQEVAGVPEQKRAMAKQKRLADSAERKKEIDKKFRAWMDKARACRQEVKL
jgi:hypothetical protein